MSSIISETKLKEITEHAANMVRLFNSERRTTMCDIFPTVLATKRIAITWRLHVFYRYHLTLLDCLLMFFGHFRVSSTEAKHEFKTFHDASTKGIRSIHWHRFLAVLTALFSYFLLLSGVIVFAVSLFAWLLYWVDRKSETRTVFDMAFSTIVPIAMIWIGFVGRKWANSFQVPGGIRQIGRWPIEYVKFGYQIPSA